MNILYINHYAGSEELGMEFRPFVFAKGLKNNGHNVITLAASFSHLRMANPTVKKSFSEENIDGIIYSWVKTTEYEGNGLKRILNMIQFSTKIFFKTKTINKKYNPNIIIASSPHPLVWLNAYLLAKGNKTKLIIETRDLWPETLIAMEWIKRNSILAKILYAIEKFIYKKADSLIFTFPGGKDYIESIGLDNSKVNFINNGIDLNKFVKVVLEYNYNDEDLDSDNNFKVLYTGTMGQANALIFLVQAAKILKRKNINDIKFILFGDGYQKAELEEYVKNNSLNNVVFKGRVDKKYIPNILSKSNLNIITGQYIYLYKYGLSPNKMFDYFASGKPTLSNVECGYDMLKQYDCGITVKGDSPEAIVEGILKFYNMPKDKYNKYCENALMAAKDFDFKILTDKLEKVILELV